MRKLDSAIDSAIDFKDSKQDRGSIRTDVMWYSAMQKQLVYLLRVVRVVGVAVGCGWLVAAAYALLFANWQYQALQQSLAPALIEQAYQARIAEELGRGSLLIYAQLGVVIAVLWWQIQQVGAIDVAWDAIRFTVRFGLVCGAFTALLTFASGWMLGMPMLILVPFTGLIIAAGALAGWYADPTRLADPTDSIDPTEPKVNNQ